MYTMMGDCQVMVLLLLWSCVMAALAQNEGFPHSYAQTCPAAEGITRNTVTTHYNSDKTILAGLLRLHFHDCFVNGCDASLLLVSTPTDGTDVERLAAGNNNSLRGFEVIDDVKTKVEAACPGVVSCADIVAMAARDASVILGGRYYFVPTGRYDGRVSNRTLANEKLPSPFWSVSQLKDNFADKGLSLQDLVLLSGGHTIGRSKCRFFESRIYNFSSTGKPDPTLNSTYLVELRQICTPEGADPSPTAPFDKGSEFNFDNSYYKNLVIRNGLLTSDQVLAETSETATLVKNLAQNPRQFYMQFTQSMIKMGNIAWKTAANGEIRKKCTAVNPTITTTVGTVSSS